MLAEVQLPLRGIRMLLFFFLILLLAMAWGLADHQLSARIEPPPSHMSARKAPPAKPVPPAGEAVSPPEGQPSGQPEASEPGAPPPAAAEESAQEQR